MDFSSETPTGKLQIQGHIFDIAMPFAEGHPCTGPEAGVLNQTLGENARNNLSARFKKALDDGSFEQKIAQAWLDEYLESYVFGVRRGRGPVDPVEREALSIAKDEVKRALREHGFKVGDYSADEVTRLAVDAVEKNPSITTEAKRRVKQRQGLAEVGIDLSKLKEPDDAEEEEVLQKEVA